MPKWQNKCVKKRNERTYISRELMGRRKKGEKERIKEGIKEKKKEERKEDFSKKKKHISDSRNFSTWWG